DAVHPLPFLGAARGARMNSDPSSRPASVARMNSDPSFGPASVARMNSDPSFGPETREDTPENALRTTVDRAGVSRAGLTEGVMGRLLRRTCGSDLGHRNRRDGAFTVAPRVLTQPPERNYRSG